jgi:chromosome segregation protein
VYLKSLTLRGFKSFASATTLRLEPGITCVVGPNGSGKSNILDALSWVMGEQGAKSLRGGKMEDVIFAGTTSRAPLGRAEVTLTIDNSDGALPIDYAEVTISRLMFRDGRSEYAINGDGCRLLDVQDLLSDSGLGREMHVIVGQGQLDQILHAGPEARRAIIEEAAGILKHRKRKEKALRKLDAMQANLTRLVDLTSELNRRLKPLGRQAEVARKAAAIQADLRDARLRLLADDYLTLRGAMEREAADEAQILVRRTELEAALGAARELEAELDAAAQAQALTLSVAQQTWFRLSSLTEKLRSVHGLASERARLLGSDQEPQRSGRDPDDLDRQADELRFEEASLTERLTEGQEVLAEAVAERSAAEAALAATERRLATAAREAAGRAERLARLRGMTDAADSRAAASAEEIDRLTIAAADASARAASARAEHESVHDVADVADIRAELAAKLERSTGEHNAHTERVGLARKAERAANSEVAAFRARGDALAESLRQGVDATAAVLADPGRFGGVLGSFAARLTVRDGYQKAIAAALGAAAEALTVDGLDTAVEVLAGIRAANAGTVALVIAAPVTRPGVASDQNGDSPIPPDAASGQIERPGVASGQNDWSGSQPGVASGQSDWSGNQPGVASGQNGAAGNQPGVASGRSGWSGSRPGVASDQNGDSLIPPDAASGQIERPGVASGQNVWSGSQPGAASGQNGVAGDQPAGASGRNGAVVGRPTGVTGASNASEAPARLRSFARPALAEGCTWATDLVTGSAELAGAVAELLGDVAVTRDLAEAAAFVRDNPDFRAVTTSGDLIGAHWARGGTAGGQSLLDVRSAADEAAAKLAAAEIAAEAAAEALAEATEALESARQALEELRGQLQVADSAAAEVSGRLGRLAGAARAAADEAKRIETSVEAARRTAEKDQAKLAQLRAELAAAEAEEHAAGDAETDNELAAAEREEMTQRAAAARNVEMEARLEVRTVEERLRAISGRADQLAAAAAAERTARAQAAERRRQRGAQAAMARAVAVGAARAVQAAEASQYAADQRRSEVEQAHADSSERLKAVRVQLNAVTAELDTVVNSAHGSEIARNEHRLRLEQLGTHVTDEYGIEPGILVAEYGPGVPVLLPEDNPLAIAAIKRGTARPAPVETTPVDPASAEPAAETAQPGPAASGPAAPGHAAAPGSLADALRAVRAEAEAGQAAEATADPEPGQARRPRKASEPSGPEAFLVPYVRAEQEERAAEAEKQLAKLGKVNPLALEEYAALQERHQFLATQLEDLRKTRRDLLTVVKEVDDRVQEVFTSAYADTAREFEGLFSRLFPGGSGRLILTEPDDMLTTGIEVEARPPGKKVKRLSLLSGGERSLTAIAYLFAIFKARPSPFYVLDEVEAALDDSNLQRLLRVFAELRESSQLIVITHQRRTMEAADALYGVSMRGDGVSQVISQRVREAEPA